MSASTSLPCEEQRLSPQCRRVLDHMRRAGSITGVEASAVHRIRHLPRRVKDLKEKGFTIRAEPRVDVTNQRYVRYFLEGIPS